MRVALQFLIAATLASPALAQPLIVADSGDSAWVLGGALVALVTILPGLILCYARGTALRPVIGGLALALLAFVVAGYSLAFVEGSALLGNTDQFLLRNLADLRDQTTISESIYVVFELVAALVAVGIVLAAVVDRARAPWLVAFAPLWLIFVYVPLAHWTWLGWLADLGTIDIGGGLVVQASAGLSALVLGILLRSRSTAIAIDDDARVSLGALLVGFGGVALLGAATLGASDEAGVTILNALVAIAASVAVTLVATLRSTSGDRLAFAVIAGVASISAGSSLVGIGGAIVLGTLGGIVAVFAATTVAKLRLGGAATAFAVHGVAGLVGAVLFPLLIPIALGGPGYDEGSDMVALVVAQGIAVVTVVLWSIIVTAIVALMVSLVAPMRDVANLSRPS